MAGIFYAIGAAFFLSNNNLIDKHLTNKHATDGNVWAIVILSSLFPAVLLPVAYTLGNVQSPNVQSLTLLFCGSLMVCWLFFYLKSLTEADTSVVMTMLLLAPFFALMFSYLLLNETLTLLQLLGGALLMSASILASYESEGKRLNKNLLVYAFSASTVMGLMHTLFKLETINGDFWTNIFWRSLGMVGTGLLLCLFFKSINTRFYTYLTQYFKRGLLLGTTNESLTILGDISFAFAILLAPVAIIQTTEAYQPIFIILISFILSGFGYTSFKAEASESLYRKLLAICIVLLGSAILVFNS